MGSPDRRARCRFGGLLLGRRATDPAAPVYIVAVIRWLRLVATATVILSLIGLGVVAGLFLVANSGWIPVTIPPWLIGLFGDRPLEVWLPALIAGWLASATLLAVLVLWSMFYVWRRRQYESLIGRLERELAKLRNLPFTEPAPLEDLPEVPDAHAARVMHALDDEDDDAL
jgi:hypothetical protein